MAYIRDGNINKPDCKRPYFDASLETMIKQDIKYRKPLKGKRVLSSSDIKSLRMFTALSSVWGIVYGLIGPFYAVYVSNITGGMDKLGFAFSIMILVQAATSYIVGHYSDRLGRKPFLFITAYADAAILLVIYDSGQDLSDIYPAGLSRGHKRDEHDHKGISYGRPHKKGKKGGCCRAD